MKRSITIAPEAYEALASLSDKKKVSAILDAIDDLALQKSPLGKDLRSPLEGYRTVRVCENKYRVIYGLSPSKLTVLLIGERLPGKEEDIYFLAWKLIRLLKRSL